jgi:hypothetical protein
VKTHNNKKRAVLVLLLAVCAAALLPAQSTEIRDLENQLAEAQRNTKKLESELDDAKSRTARLEKDLAAAKKRRKLPVKPASGYYKEAGAYLGVDFLPYVFSDKENYDPGFEFKPKAGFNAGRHTLGFSMDAFAIIWAGNKYPDDGLEEEDGGSGTLGEKEPAVEARAVVLREGFEHNLPAVDLYVFHDSHLQLLFGNYNSVGFYDEIDWNDPEITGLAVPEAAFKTSLGGLYGLSFAFALPVSYLPGNNIYYRHKTSFSLPLESVSLNASLLYNSDNFYGYMHDIYSSGGYYFCAEVRFLNNGDRYFYTKYDSHWETAEDDDPDQQVELGFRLGNENFGVTVGFGFGSLYAPELGAALSVNGGIEIKF